MCGPRVLVRVLVTSSDIQKKSQQKSQTHDGHLHPRVDTKSHLSHWFSLWISANEILPDQSQYNRLERRVFIKKISVAGLGVVRRARHRGARPLHAWNSKIMRHPLQNNRRRRKELCSSKSPSSRCNSNKKMTNLMYEHFTEFWLGLSILAFFLLLLFFF